MGRALAQAPARALALAPFWLRRPPHKSGGRSRSLRREGLWLRPGSASNSLEEAAGPWLRQGLRLRQPPTSSWARALGDPDPKPP
jgi:hypothetical protein